jgi:hypothetical protein
MYCAPFFECLFFPLLHFCILNHFSLYTTYTWANFYQIWIPVVENGKTFAKAKILFSFFGGELAVKDGDQLD